MTFADWYPVLLVAPLFATVPITLFLVAYLYRRNGLEHFSLVFLVGAATIWASAYGMEVLLPDFDQKMAAATLQYLGIVFVPFGWLWVGLHLSDQRHLLRPWLVALLLAVPMATLVEVHLWRSSEFFWRSQEMVPYGAVDLIAFGYGPGFWVHIGYCYLLQLVGGVLIVGSIFTSHEYFNRQRVAVALALILPWAVNAIYVFKLSATPIDFTPLAIVISASIMVVGVLRYGLGDLLPVAREKIFAETREGVMLFDDRLRLVDANPAARAHFGGDSVQIGCRAQDLFAREPELLDLLRKAPAAAPEPAAEASGEEGAGGAATEVLSKDSAGRPLSIKCECIGTRGRVRMLRFHDLSLERQLQHAQKLESLGVLTGGIAHDFNNLLMPIVGYLDLLQDRTREDERASEYLGRIRDAAGKLSNLCVQMLTYSGKGQSIRMSADLNELIARLEDLVRASVPRQLQVEYRLAPGLDLVRLDHTQLDQVVINLVMNAAESMSDRTSGSITVATGERVLDAAALRGLGNGEAASPGAYVYLEVEDHGVGIDDEALARLFEPFFTTKFTGRGLGMSVVFGIVRDHDGAIEVETEPGWGTRVRVYFPRDESAERPAGRPAAPSRRVRGGGRVLVVDDQEMVRQILASMLEAAGYEVVTAVDGQDGMTRFLEHEPELVGCVVDVTMPERDGLTLVRDIRQRHGALPLVLVSGYPASEYQAQIDELRVAFLQKPFEVDEIVAALGPAGPGLADAVQPATLNR